MPIYFFLHVTSGRSWPTDDPHRWLLDRRDDDLLAAARVRLTWQVLKSIWNAERVPCPNCDQPLVLVAFEWRMGMLSFRSARITRHCHRCRRRFVVLEEKPLAWLAKVLPPTLRPTHVRLWDSIPINWSVPSLGVGRPVQLGAGAE